MALPHSITTEAVVQRSVLHELILLYHPRPVLKY